MNASCGRRLTEATFICVRGLFVDRSRLKALRVRLQAWPCHPGWLVMTAVNESRKNIRDNNSEKTIWQQRNSSRRKQATYFQNRWAVACRALTSFIVAKAAMLITPAALAGRTARYYSSKQPYVAPARHHIQQFRTDTILHTPSANARHGLAWPVELQKYDALLTLMSQSAAENNYAGFVSPEVGELSTMSMPLPRPTWATGMACSLVRAPYSIRALVREYTSVMLICSPMPQSRDCASHTRARVSLVQPNPERISN